MRKIILKLFDAEKAPPLLFLTTTYLVGITINSLTDTIKDLSGFSSESISLTGLIILIVIMAILDPIPKYLNYLFKGRGSLISSMGGLSERHKGLIVLCSVGENISAEQAIRYHYRGINNEYKEPVLKHCWMLTGGNASLDASQKLIAKLKSEGLPEDLFETVEMSGEDADNPSKVYKIIEDIFENLHEGFSERDIIADYTGGTKSMTAGLILACTSPERKLQILKPRKYKEDGTADRTAGSDPKLIDIRFKLKEV